MKTDKIGNIEKVIRASRLSKLYNEINDSQLKISINRHLSELCGENDLSDKNMLGHQIRSIYPAIAFYKEYLKCGMSKDVAYNKIEKCAFDFAQNSAKFLQKFSKVPFFFSLFGKMCKVGTSTGFGKPGFDMIWECGTKDEIKWTCKSCFYENEFKRYGVPELTKIFCEVDDIIYGNLHRTEWARTMTIGSGDEVCDFHLKKIAK